MQALDPIRLEDIDILKWHLREHFPDLDLEKLQKVHTKKSESYVRWIEKHCRQRNYSFQIRKCEDISCCPPSTLAKEDLEWLPDPQDDNSNPGHFMLYSDLKEKDTVESYPSMKPQRPKVANNKRVQQSKSKKKAPQDDETELQNDEDENDFEEEFAEEKFGDAQLCTAQHARTTVECIECRQPRVVYAKHVLTDRQNISLVIILSEMEYSCGAPITPPNHMLHGTAMTRANLVCATTIEIPFYSAEKCRLDLCCQCGDEGAEVSVDLKKTVQNRTSNVPGMRTKRKENCSCPSVWKEKLKTC